MSAAERRLGRLTGEIDALHRRMAEHDPNDYEGTMKLADDLKALEGEVSALEERWLELSEVVA